MQIANVNAFAQPILMQRQQQANNALAAYGQPTNMGYPSGPYGIYPNGARNALESYHQGGGDYSELYAIAPQEGPPGTPQGGGDWLRYANQGATRNLPLSSKMTNALSFLADMGVEMEVFSGGQHEKGSGQKRVGSTRHDHGNAADVFFHKDGRKLDWANPQDRPIFEEIVRRGRASGLTGFGAGDGYMQQGSMHIGFGNEAVWGAGGKGANAPDWLRNAYHHPGDGHDHSQNAGALSQADDLLTILGL